jgi:hypothetical protein
VSNADCSSGQATFSILTVGNEPVKVVHRGVVKRGYPIEETIRASGDAGAARSEERLELLTASAASLDPALFSVPDGYRPALPRPGGGFILSKPDTLWNRLDAYREYAAMWVNSWLRSAGY